MEPIIEVNNLSKKYVLAHRLPYETLRDTMVTLAKKPIDIFRHKEKVNTEEFWALKNINFSVERGEAIGLIGANGSGKSTLLKILSQITSPTTGEVILRGRVASLLEVGTGFHPELTGRENIYLNGAILGMSRKEISIKFDEIVKFSGVEKFLDTPVKRYSSGMIVRLAFSVAAHMEPEILIVDEVLAVGDADFQKKSLGKMDQVTKSAGRTVIFVSHNMEAIKKLCTKCILLKDGQIIMLDETEKVVQHYLNPVNSPFTVPLNSRRDREGRGDVKFTDIRITDRSGKQDIFSSNGLRIEMKYKSTFNKPIADANIIITVMNDDLRPILRFDSNLTTDTFVTTIDPEGRILCETEPLHLTEGQYFVELHFLVNNISQDLIAMADSFRVETDIEIFHYRTKPDKTIMNHQIAFRFH